LCRIWTTGWLRVGDGLPPPVEGIQRKRGQATLPNHEIFDLDSYLENGELIQRSKAASRRHSPKMKPLIIAIDGPSGAGKSTLGRMLARALNLLYIDTGSMYRAVALAVMESSVSSNDDLAVGSLAARVDIDLAGDPEALKVTLEGRDVTDEIRSEEVTEMSSIVSTIPQVRRAMVQRQRELGARGAVMNGRDIGTVVFPDADVKFFLTAVPQERAERRFNEERAYDPKVNFEETFADMAERDRRDATRADSPLKVADDAIVVDSTGLAIDEVFEKMMTAVQEKSGGMPPS
jgi:cytidylate kinase